MMKLTGIDGGSINGYVNQAINERLQKDGFSPMQKQIAEPDRTEQAAEPMQSHPEQPIENQTEQEPETKVEVQTEQEETI